MRLESFVGQWAIAQDTLEVAEDPQTIANGYLVEYETAGGTPFRLVSVPMQYDGEPASSRRSPEFNEHGDAILESIGPTWSRSSTSRSATSSPDDGRGQPREGGAEVDLADLAGGGARGKSVTTLQFFRPFLTRQARCVEVGRRSASSIGSARVDGSSRRRARRGGRRVRPPWRPRRRQERRHVLDPGGRQVRRRG